MYDNTRSMTILETQYLFVLQYVYCVISPQCVPSFKY